MLSFLPTAAPVPGGWFRAVVKESGMKGGAKVWWKCGQGKRTSPSCAYGFLMCSVRWKAVGAGVVIRLPPHLYKCGGTEGWNGGGEKSCRDNRAEVCLL